MERSGYPLRPAWQALTLASLSVGIKPKIRESQISDIEQINPVSSIDSLSLKLESYLTPPATLTDYLITALLPSTSSLDGLSA